MGFLGFSFGKKRRRSTKRSKINKKPPARLLRICKKYKVKATVKRGSKRVYKSVKELKKLCLKKAYALKKKLMKMKKARKSKKCAKGARGKKCRTRRRKMSRFGEDDEEEDGEMEFGKRRRGAKRSRKSAMVAFNKFFKRHCAGRHGSRFGSGGNPPLSASMGYEFCPNGMGGVLGANSTGLFPSPCVNLDKAQAAAEGRINLPSYSSSMPRTPMFGARRSRFGMYEPMGGAPMFGARRSRFGGMYPPMEGETMFGARGRRNRAGTARKTKSKIGGRRGNRAGCSPKNKYGFGSLTMAQKGTTAPVQSKIYEFPANTDPQKIAQHYQRIGNGTYNFFQQCSKKGFDPRVECVAATLKFGRRR